MRLFDARQVRYDENYRVMVRGLSSCKLTLIMNSFLSTATASLRRFGHIAAIGVISFCSACVYHAPIQQGNLLDAKDIDQISVGMTQAQVRYVLGTPMVADPFNNKRWDYVYYVKLSKMPAPKKQQLIVYFEDGNVSKLERTPLGVFKSGLDTDKGKAPWYKRWLNRIV